MKKLLDNFVVRAILFMLAYNAIFIGVNYLLDTVVFHEVGSPVRPVSVVIACVAGVVTAVKYESEQNKKK